MVLCQLHEIHNYVNTTEILKVTIYFLVKGFNPLEWTIVLILLNIALLVLIFNSSTFSDTLYIFVDLNIFKLYGGSI